MIIDKDKLFGTVDDIFGYMLTRINEMSEKDGRPPVILDKHAEKTFKGALLMMLRQGKNEEILAASISAFCSGYECGRASLK